MRACLRDSAHLKMLVGLMEQQNVRFVDVAGESNHGVPWAAILVQGVPDVDVLRQAVAIVAQMIDDEHRRQRLIAERG